MYKTIRLLALTAALAAGAASCASAQPATVTATCPLTGPGIFKCVVIGTAGNELKKAVEGKGVDHLGNAAKDIRQGAGPSNDLVGRDGWFSRTTGIRF